MESICDTDVRHAQMHRDQAKVGVRFVKHDGIDSASRERLGKTNELGCSALVIAQARLI